MTPVAEVRSLIVKNIAGLAPLKAEHIHSFMNSADPTKTEPIVIISEAPDGGESYGNNNPISIVRQVQLTFYYPKDYKKDMSLIEKQVKLFLRKNRVFCYSDAGHVMTPDTQKVTNTLKFRYKEDI